jgi:hypothetical protein
VFVSLEVKLEACAIKAAEAGLILAAPINFLQLITSNSANIEALYYKGVFSAPTSVIDLPHTGCLKSSSNSFTKSIP